MFEKILVYENALADEHPALERALQLVESRGRLKVVDVVAAPSDKLRDLHRPMRHMVDQEREDRLDLLCQPLLDTEVSFKAELIRGRPFIEIVREVVHEGFQLVIKPADGIVQTGTRGMLGPVDLRLVRNCPSLVWLEIPGPITKLGKILVAIDPCNDDVDLNNTLLELAGAVARLFDSELMVVSAWSVPHEALLSKKTAPENLLQYAEGIQSTAEENIESLLARIGVDVKPRNLHVRKGKAASVILESIEIHRPDLVVMGTVGHTDSQGLLIGNTADSVLRQITCSVLTVKPESLFRV